MTHLSALNWSLRAETHSGPDGTRLEQNAHARLYKHAGRVVYENKETETDLKSRDEGKKTTPDHSQNKQIKLNNLTDSDSDSVYLPSKNT